MKKLIPLLLSFVLLCSIANAQDYKSIYTRSDAATEVMRRATVRIHTADGSAGTGTVFAIKDDFSEAMVITCAHLIDYRQGIYVWPVGYRSRVTATITYVENKRVADLMILKFKPMRGKTLSSIPLAKSSPGVGYDILTIGYPFAQNMQRMQYGRILSRNLWRAGAVNLVETTFQVDRGQSGSAMFSLNRIGTPLIVGIVSTASNGTTNATDIYYAQQRAGPGIPTWYNSERRRRILAPRLFYPPYIQGRIRSPYDCVPSGGGGNTRPSPGGGTGGTPITPEIFDEEEPILVDPNVTTPVIVEKYDDSELQEQISGIEESANAISVLLVQIQETVNNFESYDDSELRELINDSRYDDSQLWEAIVVLQTQPEVEPEERVLYFTSKGCEPCSASDLQARKLKNQDFPITIITLKPKETDPLGLPRIHVIESGKDVEGASSVTSFLSSLSF